MRRIVLVVLLTLWLVCPVGAAEVPATLVRVIDGDTIKVMTAEGALASIRLAEIDAPELHQEYGQISKTVLSAMMAPGDPLVIDVQTIDRYGRTVGRVYRTRRVDVSLEMVRRGAAWVYRQYSRDKSLAAAENAARSNRRGLWHSGAPVAPWVWRKQER